LTGTNIERARKADRVPNRSIRRNSELEAFLADCPGRSGTAPPQDRCGSVEQGPKNGNVFLSRGWLLPDEIYSGRYGIGSRWACEFGMIEHAEKKTWGWIVPPPRGSFDISLMMPEPTVKSIPS
jgi:hypothetical protein